MAKFGYETLGTTGMPGLIESIIKGSVFTCPLSGKADSITVGLVYVTGAWTGKVKCAIYKHSDLSLVGVTEERTITPPTTPGAWYIFNFAAPKPSLAAGTDYVLVAWGESAAGDVGILHDAGAANQRHYQNIAYNGFPTPLVPTHGTEKDSIYCTYTPSAPKGTIAIHAKLLGVI